MVVEYAKGENLTSIESSSIPFIKMPFFFSELFWNKIKGALTLSCFGHSEIFFL